MFFRKWIDESEFDEKNDFFDNSVMSVRQWLTVILVMLIPVVNLVMIFYWALASKELSPSNKVNWARASVIIFTMTFMALAVVAGFLFLVWYLHNH